MFNLDLAGTDVVHVMGDEIGLRFYFANGDEVVIYDNYDQPEVFHLNESCGKELDLDDVSHFGFCMIPEDAD